MHGLLGFHADSLIACLATAEALGRDYLLQYCNTAQCINCSAYADTRMETGSCVDPLKATTYREQARESLKNHIRSCHYWTESSGIAVHNNAREVSHQPQRMNADGPNYAEPASAYMWQYAKTLCLSFHYNDI